MSRKQRCDVGTLAGRCMVPGCKKASGPGSIVCEECERENAIDRANRRSQAQFYRWTQDVLTGLTNQGRFRAAIPLLVLNGVERYGKRVSPELHAQAVKDLKTIQRKYQR